MEQELLLCDGFEEAVRLAAERAAHHGIKIKVEADEDLRDLWKTLPSACVSGTEPPSPQGDLRLILRRDEDAVDRALLDKVDLTSGLVVATRTRRFWQDNPLFFISIPKAGTHALRKLLQVFGYQAGGSCDGEMHGGHFYFIYNDHAHSSANLFFNIMTDMLISSGNYHPFMTNKCLFVYRDPRDICVSLMNYSKKMHFPRAMYYYGLSDEDSLLKIIDDPWLFGNMRDYIKHYIPWMDFPNVVPVSFEEMVGAKGGGGDAEQQALIWSLQLKLHIPGRPAIFAGQLFDPASPTFHKGRIGAWREAFTPKVRERFAALPQDFMSRLGYPVDFADAGVLPAHRLDFRRRPLMNVAPSVDMTPLLVRQGFFGHNIVRYRRRFFAIPMDTGPLDLGALSDAELGRFLSGDTCENAEVAVTIKMARAQAAEDYAGRIAALEQQVAKLTQLLQEREAF